MKVFVKCVYLFNERLGLHSDSKNASQNKQDKYRYFSKTIRGVIMDSALILRKKVEKNEILSEKSICELLTSSQLIDKLIREWIEHPLFVVFRIVGLSEIPYSETLPYTQNLLSYINRKIATEDGFSCLGGKEEIVPCYNAMLLEAYCRLGLSQSQQVKNALNWIKSYQLFDRNQISAWKYDGVCKHGGCLGKTPCYIGIGKTVRALITYAEFSKERDNEVEELLDQGSQYMLRHQMYQRLSNQKPISAHITDIMMPQNYALSLTDLVYIIGKQSLANRQKAQTLMRLLQEKQVSDGQWKIDYIYSYKGYVAFESRRKASEWISFLFATWLQKK